MKCAKLYNTDLGAAANPWLPPVIDSVISKNRDSREEIYLAGAWWLPKPEVMLTWYLIRNRIYHAWLVLTGRAVAIQYASDHLELAGLLD